MLTQKENFKLGIKKISIVLGLVILSSTVGACKNEGPLEKAGKSTDNAIEDAGEAIEDAGDKVERETTK